MDFPKNGRRHFHFWEEYAGAKTLKDGRGRALALIHGDIAASWSVDTLAKEVDLSRSAFMDRFAQLIGMPPIRYLTVWRLEIAKRHLRESRMSIPQIAVAVGYESEEGFRRAFKREFEIWPAEWRHQLPALRERATCAHSRP